MNIYSVLFIALLLVKPFVSEAQNYCHRKGAFTNGPDYEVTGNVYLELQPDNTLLLKFDSTFATHPGPDLDVYLSNSPEPGQQSVNIAPLQKDTGAQVYTIPGSIALGDYWYVIIHCTQYNHFWGNAALSAMNFGCASGLSPVDQTNMFELYPNPATDYINIKPASVQGNYSCKIMDINSNTLIETGKISGAITLTVTGWQPGLYFLFFNHEDMVYIRKLLVK